MFNRALWCKIMVLMLALVLVIPALVACDDDDDEPTSVDAAFSEPKSDDSAASESLNGESPAATDEPVKIGVIIDYTGPGAMAGWLADGVIDFAEWYWNEQQGGIQVGDTRQPLEFIKYDNEGQVAGAAAAAKKALMDGVSVITLGGVSTAFGYPIADVADPENVLYTTFVTIPSMLEEYNFTVSAYVNYDQRADMIAEFIVNDLEARTVGILCRSLESDREMMETAREKILALDPSIEIVDEQYPPMDAKDFSPYLTKVKYKEPDVLLTLHSGEAYQAMAQQMMELGGWGDIKHVAYTEAGVFTGIETNPGAQGWYVPLMYLQGCGTPAQVEFGELWAQMCEADSGWCKKYSPTGSVPLPNHPTLYNPMLTAIKAVELAGSTDRAEVSKAARSGELEFDSPMGYLTIGADGETDLCGFFVKVDGALVPCE